MAIARSKLKLPRILFLLLVFGCDYLSEYQKKNKTKRTAGIHPTNRSRSPQLIKSGAGIVQLTRNASTEEE